MLLRWIITSRLLDLACRVDEEKRQGLLLEFAVFEENLRTALSAALALRVALSSFADQ
jgi:hypothetical protein